MSPSADTVARTGSAPLLGLLLLCSFLWATAYLLMKVLGADFAPMPLTAIRGVLGGGHPGVVAAGPRPEAPCRAAGNGATGSCWASCRASSRTR